MQRTTYAPEFKGEAVKQVIDTGHSVVDVAKRLGIGIGVLSTWVSKFKKADEPVPRDLKALQVEMTRLKAERRRTTDERDSLKNGRRVLCQAVRLKYAFIQAHRGEFRLTSMCRVLKVHRSGYYAWLQEPKSPRATVNLAWSYSAVMPALSISARQR